MSAVWGAYTNLLEIRFELSARNARDLRTDAAEILSLTADRYRVADLWAFAANFTLSGHRSGPSYTEKQWSKLILGKPLSIPIPATDATAVVDRS